MESNEKMLTRKGFILVFIVCLLQEQQGQFTMFNEAHKCSTNLTVGIHDNVAGRRILTNALNTVLNDPTNVTRIQQNGRVVRESLLSGPNGILKMETVWEGSRLITINLFGR